VTDDTMKASDADPTRKEWASRIRTWWSVVVLGVSISATIVLYANLGLGRLPWVAAIFICVSLVGQVAAIFLYRRLVRSMAATIVCGLGFAAAFVLVFSHPHVITHPADFDGLGPPFLALLYLGVLALGAAVDGSSARDRGTDPR
jgi:peptidoglycan/LPS O-acetylase OafA/YrhL